MKKRHDLKKTRVAREYDLDAGPVPCILVIDDEKAIRDSFAAHLEDWGCEVLVAGNGRIGLSLFEAQNPDLVIVDLRMPVVDGIQVLEQISRTSPLTPLIVASGTGIITDAIEALNCGAWEYLLKPIEDLSMLNHAVATALEKARLKRENLAYRERLERLVDERAVELAQANTDLAQIHERLRHIADTTRALSFCREVPSFGVRVLEAFGQHLSAGGGSLYLKESDGLRLIHALDKGHAADFIPFPLPDGSLFQRTMAAQAPMLVPAIDDDARVVPSGWPGYTDGSALVFPLPGEAGDIAGIMSLHNKRPSPFGEPDREIGAILAAYSSEALRGLKATETLRESEARFREILDAIPTGIVIVDAASHHIVYVNPTAAAMIGDAPESLRGSACRGVICPSDVDACPVHDGCGVEPSQRTLLKRDGREVPVLKTAVRIRLAGRDCFLESFIDLSEQIQAEAHREQLERRLRQAQRMAALGTLAGGIVHDFNNVLSTVLGYAELGLQDIQDPAHPLYPKLKAIHHAGHRARELVEQIGSFSRMQEQRPAPVKPAPFVETDDEADRRRP